MRWYHHIGIPTTEATPDETHLKHLKLFVVSHEKSEFGVALWQFADKLGISGLALSWKLLREAVHVTSE